MIKNKFKEPTGYGNSIGRLQYAILAALLLWISCSQSFALPTVTTIGGGLGTIHYGYKDGNTFSNALFRVPAAIALDEFYNFLYVADRDNNAVRVVDLGLGETTTFVPTNLTARPIGVAVDSEGNVFVLNRGSTNNISTNGYILKFDTYGTLLETNAVQLTNAASIALDGFGNIYLTVKSNTLIKIGADGIQTKIATVTNVGVSLQGLVVKQNGLIAVCDAGRHGIYLIDPATGIITTNAGFNGPGDGTGANNHGISKNGAKFFQPTGIAEAGDGSLIVTDSGNNRVKVITATIVTNLCGVSSNYWAATYPGWLDSTVKVPDSSKPNVQCRLPAGIVFANDGTIYTTETYYHLIRKVTGAGLPQPPPLPPQVQTPQIGYVDFPATSQPVPYTSVFHAESSFIFNNDAPIVIQGEAGSQTFYTFMNVSNIGLVPDPTTFSASAPIGYQDGLDATQVNGLKVAGISPFVAIKAIGTKNDGSPDSGIAKGVFQFIVGNPAISGNNAALFTISDVTANARLYYTLDGSNPGPTNSNSIDLGTVTGTNVWTVSLAIQTNTQFRARAFKNNYQPSGVVFRDFSIGDFQPNIITFGTTNGEPRSKFLTRPGQFFYAPVTLQLAAGFDKMYSLQFNVSVTNGLVNANTGIRPPAIINGGGIDFFSMLMTSVPPDEGRYNPPVEGGWYLPLPPLRAFFDGVTTNVSSSSFINTSNNLLGLGWIFRKGIKYLYSDTNGVIFLDFDTTKQDLISFSMAHDTLFTKANGMVLVGAYAFQVPTNAANGDKYFIQLGSPSATADGVGAPGADILITAPAVSQAISVSSPPYLVGDAAPFHWFNAGDFGDTNLNNADVMQTYQEAVIRVNSPPENSDLYLAMDSAGGYGAYDPINNYYVKAGTNTFSQQQAMWDGNDRSINTNAFGDGRVDINDLYITFRRSLDPSLTWFKRYWTNGQFVAVTNINYAYNTNVPHLLSRKAVAKSVVQRDFRESYINFSAGDAISSANQTIQIPINAKIFGGYPLRVLGLNLTVVPLDGSPAIKQQITFKPSAALGVPTISLSKNVANYSASWLDSTIAGLSDTATIGTLVITLPPTATASSAYVIHFDNIGASPNGLALFPKNTTSGLVTLSARTNSTYGDGIPDSWRLRWFGTANNYLSASNACPSGDGISNYKKFVAGVDPNVAGNFPSVNPKAKANTGYASTIHWPTVSGKQYVIERSTDLFAGWSAISTNTGTGGDLEYNDANTGKVKFYRVRILP